MALIQADLYSESLKRKTTVYVVLPMDIKTNISEKVPTLYLLHGLLDNHTSWIINSRIQQLAEERGIAVVMPSGENSFYVDQAIPNNNFGTYIGKELVELTRKMFPLSRHREDTAIGGLSMGGFGALRNGLKYNETFGSIIALSSALHIFEFAMDAPEREMFYNEDACFGPYEEAIKTDKNPAYILKQLREKKKNDSLTPVPKVYMACGTKDSLLIANQRFKEHLQESGINLTYVEAQGAAHEWTFWDSQIEAALEWML